MPSDAPYDTICDALYLSVTAKLEPASPTLYSSTEHPREASAGPNGNGSRTRLPPLPR